MEQIQFVGLSPQENNTQILNGVREIIEEFKKEYQPQNNTEFLSRKQVAELLQVDLSTIHNWCKAKKLKSYGLSGRVYFKRHEVESAIVQLNK